jgi:hypothetical protein
MKVLFVAPGYHPRVGGIEYAALATGYNGETTVRRAGFIA